MVMGSSDFIRATVLLPFHREGGLIDEQLAAIAAQQASFPWEIVAVDNHADDATRSRVQAWAHASPIPVRIITASERAGPAYARNVGLQSARGDIVLCCDADDRIHAGWLALLVAAVGPGRMASGACGIWNGGAERPASYHLVASSAFLGRPFARGGNVAALRSELLALGGWDETLPTGEDVDLSWRWQENGGSMQLCPQARVDRRLRSTILTAFWQNYCYGRDDWALYRKHASAPWAAHPRLRGCGPANSSGRHRFVRHLGKVAGRVIGRWIHR